jgi:hypothetical protein
MDMIPVRTQNAIDREYKRLHDKLWTEKDYQAETLVKEFLANEFPDYFKKKFLDPYSEDSPTYLEHKHILENADNATSTLLD